MKIRFHISASGKALDQIFHSSIFEEGIGWERYFGSAAELFFPREGKLFKAPPGSGEPPEECHEKEVWANRRYHKREDLLRGPTWVTYMSGFRYTILNSDSEDRAEVEYTGAQLGFLDQQLLPKLEVEEILSVEGTYGSFQGPMALEEYEKTKEGKHL